MKSKIIIALLFAFFTGCKSDKNKKTNLEPLNQNIVGKKLDISKIEISSLNTNNLNSQVINIPENIFESTIDITKLIREISFTPLETGTDFLIGDIHKVLSDSDSYFIHDRNNNKLLRFDYDGRFLNTIGNIGRGPNEVIAIWDVALDKKNKLISILDSASGKLVRYDYSGIFFDTKPMYFFYKQHEYDVNSLVFNKGKSFNKIQQLGSFSLILANLDQSPTHKAFEYNFVNNRPINNFTTIRPLRKFNNKIYYHHPHSNGIWKILNNKLIPFIKFNYEKYGLSDDAWNFKINREKMSDLLLNHTYFNGEYVVNDKICFFMINGKNKGSSVFFNQKTQNVIYGSNFKETSDKPFNLELFGNPISCRDDNFFISVKSTVDLYNLKNKILKYPVMKDKITKKDWAKLERIDETDNPIIVTYKVNDF